MDDEIMQRRANKIAIYYLNKDKKYDLDNYLLAKWITPLDFLRASWHFLTIFTGYADTYRNEQYLSKTDLWYAHERKMLAVNLNNPDFAKLSQNLMVALDNEISSFQKTLSRLMKHS